MILTRVKVKKVEMHVAHPTPAYQSPSAVEGRMEHDEQKSPVASSVVHVESMSTWPITHNLLPVSMKKKNKKSRKIMPQRKKAGAGIN